MKKVTFIISLTLISMFYIFFVNVHAEVVNVDRFKFDTSTGTIIRYYESSASGSAINLVIPNQINGVDVKKIGEGAFSHCYRLVQVKIPDGVTSIEKDAFYNCKRLTKIEIPDSVISIGDYVFFNCGNLTEIEIPDSVNFIGNKTFEMCEKLTKIEIPDSVTYIGNSVFAGCINLVQVKLPNRITSIEASTFSNCINLTEIEIPNSVTSIGHSAFAYCEKLVKVKLPTGITSIEMQSFNGCKSLTEIEIPNSVTSIGDSAFSSCESLTKIEIPNSVTSIGRATFSSCKSLTEIEIPNSVTSIGEIAFSGCINLKKVKILPKEVSIKSNPFYECSKLEAVYCYKNSTADNKELYPNKDVKFYYLDDIEKNVDFKVKDAEEKAGKEVDVYFSIDNNSGIAIYDLKVNFDKTKLIPISIEQVNSNETGGNFMSNMDNPNADLSNLDFIHVLWDNASNITYNGDLFKIRFKINEDVLYSEIPITIEFDEDGVLNENFEALTPNIVNGKITVYPPYEFGDINMDGKINTRDLLLLNQYLAEYNNVTFNSSQMYLADVYKDGIVDISDLLLLRKYLVGWGDIVLGQEVINPVSFFNNKSLSFDLESEYIASNKVKVNVLINDNPGISAFKLKLNYNKDVLTPVSLEKGNILKGDITTNINKGSDNNYVTAVWSDTSNNTNNGILYSIIFEIKDTSASNTDVELAGTERDIINLDFRPMILDSIIKNINLSYSK